MTRALLAVLLAFPTIACAGPEDGQLEIRKIADHVFLHTSFNKLPGYGYYPSNGLVVVHGNDAYIVDTPWREEDTPRLVDWIETSGFTLKASISTHFHEDRSSGIGYLNENSVRTHASALTNRFLESEGAEQAGFEFDTTEYPLLEGTIHAYYPGAGHTQDNIVIWLPQSRVLFGGCLIRSLSAGSMGNTADASLNDWAPTVQGLIEKFPDVEQVVPGHGAAGTADLLSHTLELARRVNTGEATRPADQEPIEPTESQQQ